MRRRVPPVDRSRAAPGSLLLGIGLGGLFDTLAGGLFHALTFVASLAGLLIISRATRAGARLTGRHLIGLMPGWGLCHLAEGVIDHQILTVHHVNGDNVVLWDTLFLVLGAVFLAGGAALARSGRTAEARGEPAG